LNFQFDLELIDLGESKPELSKAIPSFVPLYSNSFETYVSELLTVKSSCLGYAASVGTQDKVARRLFIAIAVFLESSNPKKFKLKFLGSFMLVDGSRIS
jgi:hypothetical protein